MADFKEIDEARKLLGLPESATLEEIKKAYRRLAVETHPDTCSEKDHQGCEDMFKKITRAKEILLDYCAGYKYPFTKADAEKVRLNKDFEYDHMRQFYDDWMDSK